MTETSPVSAPPSDGEPLIIQVVLRTDVGLVRSENQDFGILNKSEEVELTKTQLMMVADGMGGHRGGATASRLAATTVESEFASRATDDLAAALKLAFERANAKVFGEAQENPDLRGMGTTGSALVVRGNQAWFAHVGDSRIYLVRDGVIRQLTEDHSLVATMVREGLLTPKEAETHPRRNVLQRSIGVAEQVEVDVSAPFEIFKGDTFILCSDGLHGPVKDEEMQEIAGLPIEQAADKFVRLALERGAPDNVTVIVARVADVGSPEPLAPPRGEEKTARIMLDPAEAALLASEAATEPRGMIPVDPAPERGGIFKWVLIVALFIIAVAVAAMYQSQKPAAAGTPSSTQTVH